MAINTSKVVVGGIAAGIVLNVIDMASMALLVGERMKAESNAFKPGLGDAMGTMSGGQMAGYVIMNLLVGMLLVWTYAGFRPRFGPGPKTASYAALTFFILGMVLTSGYMAMGIMSPGLWLTYSVIWLVNLVLAAMVGAKLYTEEGTPG